MHYILFNQSKVYSHADMTVLASLAHMQQVLHFAPTWSILSAPVSVSAHPAPLVKYDPQTISVFVQDESDVPGAGGYHDVDSLGNPYIKLFTSTVDSLKDTPGSLLVTLTHEICETEADAPASFWGQRGDGSMIALETGDPVEDASYSIQDKHGNVGHVTNFVTPAWFDTSDKHGPYDHMGLLKAPYTRTPNGYWIRIPPGKIRPVAEFAETYPKQRMNAKMARASSRTNKRLQFELA
jgi:rRNA maturation protein Nop10